MHERIGAGVSSKALLQAFFENFAELGLQCMDVSNARSAWRHPFCLLLLELEEIEIKSAVRDLFCARERLIRNRKQ